MNTQRTNGRRVTEALPNPGFDLFDRYGNWHARFDTALEAAEFAKAVYPREEQDETGSGLGWDIQVAE